MCMLVELIFKSPRKGVHCNVEMLMYVNIVCVCVSE